MNVYRVDAQGDTVYVRAADGRDVPRVLTKHFGFLPGSAYDARKINDDELPAGEEVLE
jgi:hypothetical protein